MNATHGNQQTLNHQAKKQSSRLIFSLNMRDRVTCPDYKMSLFVIKLRNAFQPFCLDGLTNKKEVTFYPVAISFIKDHPTHSLQYQQ